MFAYCNSNPINKSDSLGSLPEPSCRVDLKMTIGNLLFLGAAGCVFASLTTKEDEKTVADSMFGDSPKREYTVYFLQDTNGTENEIVYVGRVKTANFQARMNYHQTRGRELCWKVDNLTKPECRGLEQVGMIFFHTINKNNAINNQIRGVSPTNDSRNLYFAAAKIFWNTVASEIEEMMPLSYWGNWAENEFLNGGF